tara:strand:+ start:137 stop:664 length:528 start_codon:yes stop_codon:yes gene_type:complete
MAFKKKPYNWEKVSAGDIISFKYKSKKNKTKKMQTILVLNPSLIVKGQKKASTQLIGIKIEESNKLSLEITPKQLAILEQIGNFVAIEEENNLYRLDINDQFIQSGPKGVKRRAYELLSKGFQIQGQYRTYDYYKARAGSVYLEPVKLFTKLKEKKDNKPQQPKKPEGGINENQL